MESQRHDLTANKLKLIAIIAMLIDHTAYVFFMPGEPVYVVMRLIGRITAPVMFYFVVEGYHRTRNINRYTIRLAMFAAVSYVPFVYCMEGRLPSEATFLRLNVIYTILIGLLFIRAKNEIQNPVVRTLAMALLLVLSVPGDWTYIALLMMLVFDHFYGDYRKQKFAYILVILTAGNLINYFVQPILLFISTRHWDFSIYRMAFSEIGMFIPIFLLGWYNGRLGGGGKAAKWGFYLFYPAHLLILGLIRDIW